jgi:1-aminocyclopropane-1-carboxylate deaminase
LKCPAFEITKSIVTFVTVESENQDIVYNGLSLTIKREDLLHPFVSGNKFRKLKYNIRQAIALEHHTLITFGGAYSNHIAATAYACQEAGLKCIGIIRGEELHDKVLDNPTLSFAKKCGMVFDFVSRADYQEKATMKFLSALQNKYGEHYLLPEGGSNELAVQGCEEILNERDDQFDFICCAVGTGGTIAGMINSAASHQKIIGFPALKGDFLKQDIRKFAKKSNWDLIVAYHFGGYGKVTVALIDFLNDFYNQTKVPLDPIYTGKMVFGVIDLIQKDYFPKEAKILLIHTGGLQGIAGMNYQLEKRKIKKIVFDE